MNKEENLISIVIPTYNSEKYIKTTVDSALNQTYKNLEIVVVDDGSTDHTLDILKAYIDTKKIRYFFQQNAGVSSARNLGIRECTGKFISFLDADDIYMPNKILKQVEVMFSNCNAAVVICDTLVFFDHDLKNIFFCSGLPSISKKVVDLRFNNFINMNCALIDKRIIGDNNIYFDEALRTSEDWDFWIRLSKVTSGFVFHDDKLVFTRLRADSMQSNLVMQKKNDILVSKKNFSKAYLYLYFKLMFAYILAFQPIFLQKFIIRLYRKAFRYTYDEN